MAGYACSWSVVGPLGLSRLECHSKSDHSAICTGRNLSELKIKLSLACMNKTRSLGLILYSNVIQFLIGISYVVDYILL